MAKQSQLLWQPTRPTPMVATSMGTLSLCADSAHSPGKTTHQQSFINGVCTSLETTKVKIMLNTPKVLRHPVNTTVTSYCYHNHLSTTPGLHATSTSAHPYNNSTATRQLTDWYSMTVVPRPTPPLQQQLNSQQEAHRLVPPFHSVLFHCYSFCLLL
jgi:hypothetical protein